jgi:hypothetical protein
MIGDRIGVAGGLIFFFFTGVLALGNNIQRKALRKLLVRHVQKQRS